MSYPARVRAKRKQKEDETPLLFQGDIAVQNSGVSKKRGTNIKG